MFFIIFENLILKLYAFYIFNKHVKFRANSTLITIRPINLYFIFKKIKI